MPSDVKSTPASSDQLLQHIICFSHLRWNFVYQRPQHLLSRFTKKSTVVYFEEPVHAQGQVPGLRRVQDRGTGVLVVTPEFPFGTNLSAQTAVLRTMLDDLLRELQAERPVLWFYTPMMFAFASHVEAGSVVYDCMDELSHFRFAPPELPSLERALMARADVMFTGGHSLYEAKRAFHHNIHPFPSSVDTAHFQAARHGVREPDDQAGLPSPRLGFYGVIDERMDISLLEFVARSRPDWTLVIVGPVVKIDPATLPNLPNIHYLGGKTYAELPAYLGGWDVALMPFAINDSTTFISPTKTPEYLAGGKPVVSTPIRDVVRHYSALEAVRIADGQENFLTACSEALAMVNRRSEWIGAVDDLLSTLSWDKTHAAMAAILEKAIAPDLDPAIGTPSMPRRVQKPIAADVLVVGAGFAGSVMAERIASQTQKRVLLIDRRSHIAGNAFDYRDSSGLLVHRYGPHIFHTNSDAVADYLSRFTQWRPYEHRVLACLSGAQGDAALTVPIPINRTTINRVYGLDLKTDEEVAAYLAGVAETRAEIETSEDVVVARVGRDLYERFFRGYTRKQWALDPAQLDKAVAARIPARTNTDDRYFTDSFQAMPLDGYTRMFERMLDHPRIDVRLETDFAEFDQDSFEHVVFTGPIDEYFGFQFGKLPYRSLRFVHTTLDQERFQAVGTVNYPDEAVPYTRITEFKHLTGQQHRKTSVVHEYPCADGDPYYPVPRPENQALFKRYEALARATPHVTFVGRLATYRYYNMDQVVGQALATFKSLSQSWTKSPRSSTVQAAVAVAD